MPVRPLTRNERYWACLFTRWGIGFTFFYAGVSSFLNPNVWVGFIPVFASNIVDGYFLLSAFSVYEIFLALWLFVNKKTYYAAIVSAVTMFVLVVFNLGVLDIIFRDVAIFFSAIALAILTRSDSS